jgi:uncharacterized membrane protein
VAHRTRIGKRFAAFLISTAALAIGFVIGRPEIFPTFATTIGLLYGAYLGGQSATDWKSGGGSSAPVKEGA